MMYHDEMRKTTPPRPLFLAADADAATTTNNRMEQINLDGRMRYNLWWYRPGTLLPSEIETDRRPPCFSGVSLLEEFWEHFLTRLSHFQRFDSFGRYLSFILLCECCTMYTASTLSYILFTSRPINKRR